MKHIELKGYAYFITSVTYQRDKVFINKDYAGVVVDAIFFLRRQKRCYLFGFVIMPDHVHLAMLPRNNHSLSKIMQSVKGYTSRLINLKRNKKGVLWQKGYYEHIVRDRVDILTKIKYMENNPVRAGLTSIASNYEFSSANSKYQDKLDLWLL